MQYALCMCVILRTQWVTDNLAAKPRFKMNVSLKVLCRKSATNCDHPSCDKTIHFSFMLTVNYKARQEFLSPITFCPASISNSIYAFVSIVASKNVVGLYIIYLIIFVRIRCMLIGNIRHLPYIDMREFGIVNIAEQSNVQTLFIIYFIYNKMKHTLLWCELAAWSVYTARSGSLPWPPRRTSNARKLFSYEQSESSEHWTRPAYQLFTRCLRIQCALCTRTGINRLYANFFILVRWSSLWFDWIVCITKINKNLSARRADVNMPLLLRPC